MSRPIEFRAWDRQLKTWLSARETYEQVENQARWNPEVGEYFNLIQFTGLLDCNGKKIFEKDRTRVQLSNGSFVMATVEFVDGCFELHFDKPVCIYPNTVTRDYLKCWTVNHAVEVIGNIFYNPELLENTNGQ